MDTHKKIIFSVCLRLVPYYHIRTSSITKMLSELGWSKLADRRRDLRIALLYKVVQGQVAVSDDSLGLVKADNRGRSSNQYQFKTIFTNTTQYKNYFEASPNHHEFRGGTGFNGYVL